MSNHKTSKKSTKTEGGVPVNFLDTFINKTTLSLGAVVVFGLTLFGYQLGGHDLELGLGLLAASRVVE